MPSKTTKTNIFDKLKKKAGKAFSKTKDESTAIVGGFTPAGIEGGVARLTSIKIDEYKSGNNKGELYFSMMGVCILPKKLDGIPVSGTQFNIREDIFSTPNRRRKTVEEHMEYINGILIGLGVEVAELEDTDDFEEVFKQLIEDGPYFRFRSWKGKPAKTGKYKGVEPQTAYFFQGGLLDFDEESSDNDDEIEEEDEEGEVDEEAETEGEDELPTDDLDELAELADGDDEPAQERLNELALEAGISQAKVNKADNWTAVAELIKEQQTEDEEESEEEESEEEEGEDDAPDLDQLGADADEGDEDAASMLEQLAEEAELDPNDYDTWAELAEALGSSEEESEEEEDEEEQEEEEEAVVEPDKGDVVSYKPPRAKKAVECDVTAVFKSKQTCNLKDLANGKVYKGVSWSDLIVE